MGYNEKENVLLPIRCLGKAICHALWWIIFHEARSVASLRRHQYHHGHLLMSRWLHAAHDFSGRSHPLVYVRDMGYLLSGLYL